MQQIKREEEGALDNPQIRIPIPESPVEISCVGVQQTGVNAAQAMIGQLRATFTAEDEAASGFSNQPGQLRNQPCPMQVGKIFFLADVNKPPIFANRFVSPVSANTPSGPSGGKPEPWSSRQQFLYFRPLPQEQGSFLPIFMMAPPCCYSGKIRKAPLDAYR
jgi:hypothetical protein